MSRASRACTLGDGSRPRKLDDEEAGLGLRQHFVAIAAVRREDFHVVVSRVLGFEGQTLAAPPAPSHPNRLRPHSSIP
jgi:hypothetical protein